MYRHVSKFDGQHVYSYLRHTLTLAYESSGLLVIGVVCVGSIVYVTCDHGLPAMSTWGTLSALVALLATMRLLARGQMNRIRKDLTGRHVVITGATSGVGKATAAQLAAMGAHVTILSRDSPHAMPALAYVRSHCRDPARQQIRFQTLDLSDFVAVRDYAKRARQRNQPIDILVNNSAVIGAGQVNTRFGDDLQLAVNFLGPYLLTEGLLPLVAAVRGRVVYVSCSAHVGVRSGVVSHYVGNRGQWKRCAGLSTSADQSASAGAAGFDCVEQFAFTKLGNIYHTQDLATRSYVPLPESSKEAAMRSVRASNASYVAAAPSAATTSGALSATASTASVAASSATPVCTTKKATSDRSTLAEPRYTTCACNPGGVLTGLVRHVAMASVLRCVYYPALLFMRTAWEGSQVVVNCCLRDELRNGGYYMHTRYTPGGLSRLACDVAERANVMRWTQRRMQSYMKWD